MITSEQRKRYNDSYNKKYPGRNSANANKWRSNNLERANISVRNHFIKTHYNLTSEDVKKMNEVQKGLCYICGNPPSKRRNQKVAILDIDHNRITGQTRKLLCRSCNLGIRSFEDPRSVMWQNYLREHLN